MHFLWTFVFVVRIVAMECAGIVFAWPIKVVLMSWIESFCNLWTAFCVSAITATVALIGLIYLYPLIDPAPDSVSAIIGTTGPIPLWALSVGVYALGIIASVGSSIAVATGWELTENLVRI